MEETQTKRIYYTNTPLAYDYETTKTIEIIGIDTKGNTYRKVEIPERIAEYQIGRYNSCMCYCSTDDKELVDYLLSLK